MDGLSHELLGVTSTKRFGDKVPSLFAHRLKLRDILKTHLDVRHSKHFVRYEQDADGVTAYFKDGTSTRGSLLIGADGANSSVRTQLLQGFKAAPSQYLTALGKVVLPKEHYAPLLEHSTAGPLAAGPDDKTYCLLMEYLEDGRAVFNWNVSWRSKNLEEDYQKMVASGPEAQLEMVKQRLEKWPPAMRKAIGQTKVGDLQWPPVRLMETVLPPHGLPRGRVTLVGDAAHSMVSPLSPHGNKSNWLTRVRTIGAVSGHGS